jgi:hypothetical protein
MRQKRLLDGSGDQKYLGRSRTSEPPKSDFLRSFIDVSREPRRDYVLARAACRIGRQRAARVARAGKSFDILAKLYIVANAASSISFNVKLLSLLVDTSATDQVTVSDNLRAGRVFRDSVFRVAFQAQSVN